MPPLSREVVEFILKCFAKSKRTKWVYEQTDLMFPLDGITIAQVRAVATVHGIETERGSAAEHPRPGRKKGQKDSKPRKERPNVRAEVWRLYDASNGQRSASSIAEELGIERATAAKWIKKAKERPPLPAPSSERP